MENNSIIIIDDDADVLDVFRERLELDDIQVLGTAKDGKNGLELFEKVSPECVVLDLTMPKYDGFYFLEKVNKDFLSKIIVCTGDLSPESTRRLESFRVKAILWKPIDGLKLIKEIKL